MCHRSSPPEIPIFLVCLLQVPHWMTALQEFEQPSVPFTGSVAVPPDQTPNIGPIQGMASNRPGGHLCFFSSTFAFFQVVLSFLLLLLHPEPHSPNKPATRRHAQDGGFLTKMVQKWAASSWELLADLNPPRHTSE